jgi:hypothetical protein
VPVPVTPPPPQQPEPQFQTPPVYLPPAGNQPPPPIGGPVVPPTPPFCSPAPGGDIGPAALPRIGGGSAGSGFYGNLELFVLWPQLRGSLSGPVTVGGKTETVFLGNAGLDATGSPLFELGYRISDEIGAVAISYRSVVATGTDTVALYDVDGPGFLRTLINFNVVDLDYASPVIHIAPLWDLAWRGGVRIAACYSSDEILGGFKEEEATNNFVGAGPFGAVEVGRSIPLIPGLAATAKIDGSLLFGNISQSYQEVFALPGGQLGGADRINHFQTVETFTLDIGLSYSPPGAAHWARFGFGYQFEYWWNLGTTGGSHLDYLSNGLYFRGEFNF